MMPEENDRVCEYDEDICSVTAYNFKDLFSTFIAGTPIKRKVWGGYWKYRYGEIEMHNKSGTITKFSETKDIIFTISGILENDWEVATNENCLIEVN